MGNSKWVCVKSFTHNWIVGRVYHVKDGEFESETDKLWVLHPTELTSAEFKEVTFPRYYEQVLLLRRDENQ